ncbi:hypothetical protein PG999_004660 [Apiospora kogelbergensis]|uniref:Uncharacterized protein n=1 Tax=Apiospora kogelbergensis TaxID=1337665 RepID=A0AAW0QZZ4_9PEZI
MEYRPVLRPLKTLLGSCSRAGQTRLQSTTRRTKKALKLPPHPSFLASAAEADHIIYNPRALRRTSTILPSSSSHPRTRGGKPSSQPFCASIPALEDKHQTPTPKYNVTREQVAEMRALRAADPMKWSVVRLAEKFECSNLFVMMCCKASAEHQAKERERKEAIKSSWGPIRTQAREDRKKRRTLLLRSEL